MKGTMHIIKPDGEIDKIFMDRKPTLEEWQREVQGYVQEVPDFPIYESEPCVVLANEDGFDLPFNQTATAAWRKYLDSTGRPYVQEMATLRGRVVILTGDKEFLNA